MKDLDHYFHKAAKQEEIVPISRITEMLSQKERQAKNQPAKLLHLLLHRREVRFASIALFLVVLASTMIFLAKEENQHEADQRVFVPQTQRRVMRLVNSIAASPENSEISISQFGSETNDDTTDIPIHLRSKFELSEDKLKLLGITFTDSLIKYEGNVKGKGYVSFSVVKMVSTSVSVDDKHWPDVKEYEFYPWFLSDEDGFQGVRYKFDNEPALKMTQSFFYDAIDQLIPIQVNRQGFRKVIFWFSQTPELMNILESAAMISEDALPEQRSADKTNSTIQIEIYPTITTGEVQVITNVLKRQRLEIALLSSSGELIQIPVKSQELNAGDHNFTLDLSSLRKGLYFIRIKSDPGLITIHRLFKE